MNASYPSAPESVVVSTEHLPVFITARELRKREQSDVLDVGDVWRLY